MGGVALPASTADAAVMQMLGTTQDALDGFPAQAVLKDYLKALAEGPAASARARDLAEHILAQWATEIDANLTDFPRPTMEALQVIQRRMIEARDALSRLRWLVHDLDLAALPDRPSGEAEDSSVPVARVPATSPQEATVTA